MATNYIGVIQFGTEQKHATSNVTFSVDSFAMGATKGKPKQAAAAVLECSRLGLIFAVIFATVLGML